MTRDIQNAGSEPTQAHSFSRREVLGLLGATAAASLVGGPGEESASAQTQHTNGRIVRIDAKPDLIGIDTAKSAVIVVDMQNDFASKGGMLDRLGTNISMIQRAVPPTARVIAAGRKAGLKIVYLKMGFRADLSDMGTPDSPNWIGCQKVGVGTTVRAHCWLPLYKPGRATRNTKRSRNGLVGSDDQGPDGLAARRKLAGCSLSASPSTDLDVGNISMDHRTLLYHSVHAARKARSDAQP